MHQRKRVAEKDVADEKEFANSKDIEFAAVGFSRLWHNDLASQILEFSAILVCTLVSSPRFTRKNSTFLITMTKIHVTNSSDQKQTIGTENLDESEVEVSGKKRISHLKIL